VTKSASFSSALAAVLIVVACALESRPPIDRWMSVDNVTVGRSAMSDVYASFGSAALQRLTRDDSADLAVCYEAADRDAFLLFETGSMGLHSIVTGFVIVRRRPDIQCRPVQMDVTDIAVKSGITLGSSHSDFEANFPFPFQRTGEELIYESIDRHPMTDAERVRRDIAWPGASEDFLDVTRSIRARFDEDGLVEYQAREVVSY
jgi:hypothetical protein